MWLWVTFFSCIRYIYRIVKNSNPSFKYKLSLAVVCVWSVTRLFNSRQKKNLTHKDFLCNKHIYTQNSKMSAGVKVSEPGMEGSVKNEEVFEAAKKMMGREFQTVLAALLKILPDYEDMLVKFIMITPLFIVTLTIAHISLQSATLTNKGQVYKIQISHLKLLCFCVLICW